MDMRPKVSPDINLANIPKNTMIIMCLEKSNSQHL
uniref:Uncharacterized protein n=1 Tax=Rhizophora mucronata TaxID=61149 RepID=A0A2P2QJH5_RHIMU